MVKDVIPKVSVIMPVFNAGNYISRAIESILNQSLTNFEFLIFNDGSTDESLAIIRSFKDERIKLFNHNINSGYVTHLNYGIKISRGKYIARMDADDISLPNRLYEQYSFMEENPQFGLVASDINIIDESDKISGKHLYNKILPLEWLLIWQNPIAHPTTFFRRALLDKNDLLYDGLKMPAEDYDLWTKLIMRTKFRILDRPILNYRILTNSAYNSNKSNAIDISKDISYAYICSFLRYPIDSAFLKMTEFTMVDSRISHHGEFSLELIRTFYNTVIPSMEAKFNWNSTETDSIKFDFLKRVDIFLYRERKHIFRRVILLSSVDFFGSLRYFKSKYLF